MNVKRILKSVSSTPSDAHGVIKSRSKQTTGDDRGALAAVPVERETPLRAQILTNEALTDLGTLTAENSPAARSERRSRALRARFQENCRILENAYSVLAEAAKNKEVMTPGADWLLDNYHIVQQNVSEVRKYFPEGYDRTLPKLTSGPLEHYPRVYHLALQVVMHSDASVHPDLLTAFIHGFQLKEPLSTGELWALPIMLKFALLENLRRLVKHITDAREARLAADSVIAETLGKVADGSTAGPRGSDLLLLLAKEISERPDVAGPDAVHLLRQLRERSAKAPLALKWFEEQLREKGYDPDELVTLDHEKQAYDQVSIGNSINSLRELGSVNWRAWFEEVSVVDAELGRDPSGVYPKCDFYTRDRYRHEIEWYSRWTGRSEADIAGTVVELAVEAHAQEPTDDRTGHVGFYLVGEGRDALETRLGFEPPFIVEVGRHLRRRGLGIYLGVVGLLTLLFVGAAALRLSGAGASVVLTAFTLLAFFVPASDIAINLVQWFVNHVTPPTHLAKLSLDDGVPESARTLVAVHGIFEDKDSVAKFVEGLEVRHLANDDDNIYFAVLADLADTADTDGADPSDGDSDEPIVPFAKRLVADLNLKHPTTGRYPRFHVLFRRRRRNDSEGKSMGWERKRGKVSELNRLVTGGGDTSFVVTDEERELLRSIRYVITLDGDSQLPGGTARKLIGTISHPLQRIAIDPKRRVVTRGYGIIQPRVSVSLTSAHASRFASIFSGQAGLDPYTMTVSDFYQDLFGEGSFVGKGIYDVHAFEHCMRGRVPENSVLSHDLFEGLFIRVGLASDIELFDEFPSRYNVYAKRQHRWVRGDWQLVPWIASLVPAEDRTLYPNPLSALGRWKLFDNLRRSLVAPSLFALLAAALTVIPGSPLPWLAAALLVIAFPVYTNIATLFIIPPLGLSLTTFAKGFGRDLWRHTLQAFFSLSFLPHQAYLMVHATVVTLYRLLVSRRNLLEWETAYHSEKRLGTDVWSFVAQMRPSLALVAALLLVTLLSGPGRLLVGVPLAALWLSAPLIAARLSEKPLRTADRPLSAAQTEYLSGIAYDTWRYFRDNLTADHHYLIPDNIQLTPQHVVADRTSPTNVSLSLLAVASSYECGYEPSTFVVPKLEKTFETLARLERYNGHFLNWYSTTTLEPLNPRYVSTVDSGNFVGHLMALRGCLAGLPDAPLVTKEHWSNLHRRLRHVLSGGRGDAAVLGSRPPAEGAEKLAAVLAAAAAADCEVLGDLVPRLTSFAEAFGGLADSERLLLLTAAPEFDSVLGLARLVSAPGLPEEALAAGGAQLPATLRGLAAAAGEGPTRDVTDDLDRRREALMAAVAGYVASTDFAFLYDKGKSLFPTGYNVETARKDTSCYDLLASECRLASLVAIAKGDVPQRHWFALGRSLADTPGGKALLSWSGTMFEYLMPIVVTDDYPSTLLSETYRAVVEAQRKYGERRGVPWGISESAYSGVDFNSTYQYRAFGVPGLGLKRGLENDLVVSPYSTFLALMVEPHKAFENIRPLEAEGLRGEYGFYEAVDYTRDRLSGNEKRHVVKSFFAHHQGMTFLSVTNVLAHNVLRRWFHRDPMIKAVELLLHERFPQRIPLSEPHQAPLSFVEDQVKGDVASRGRRFVTPHTVYPKTHILSNTRLTTLVDNAGTGLSLFDRDLSLTRWKEDSTDNRHGIFVYVRDLESGDYWSGAYQPTRATPDQYEVLFNTDKVEFLRRDRRILTSTEITVAQDDDVEVRRVTVTNLSTRKRSIELTSYGEVVLGPTRADVAHPAFSKIFIESRFDADSDALRFSRRPRSPKDARLFLFHSMTAKTVWSKTQYDSSRADFLGRGRTPTDPVAMERRALSGSEGIVLDPVFALRTVIELDAGATESVSFITGVTRSEEHLDDLIQRYRSPYHVNRAFELSWSRSSVELRNKQFTASQINLFQTLATALFYPVPVLRAPSDVIAKNRSGQSSLWRFGVSGDLPIVLVKIHDSSHVKVAAEAVLAHYYLRTRGITFDLILFNENPGGYFQLLQEELENMLRVGPESGFVDKRGGVFLRTPLQLSAEETTLLGALARVVVDAASGDLSEHLARLDEPAVPSLPVTGIVNYAREGEYPRVVEDRSSTEFGTPYGGFVEGGGAYRVFVRANQLPPAPWSNVIANPHFGSLVTESGGGYTWSENSRENRLTPWSNDPVTDPCGEVIYVRDAESGIYWCPTPAPVRSDVLYTVDHGFGYSRFESEQRGVASNLTVIVSGDERVKWWNLTLRNKDKTQRRLEAYLYVDFVLGVTRSESARQVVTGFEPNAQCLYAVNHYNNEFAGRCVFVGSSLNVVSFTADRAEFIGRNRDLSSPLALDAAGALKVTAFRNTKRNLARLSQSVGAGLDPCGVIKVLVNLEPGEERRLLFFLGETPGVDALKVNVARYRSTRSYDFEQESTRGYWKGITGAIEVKTPDRAFDVLVNGWLLYQTVSCRLYGRTGFYQSGGAFGFRDQLQDVLALLFVKPKLVRQQILLHSSRQFVEGDVQHWWHPPTGRGVRTKISDDFLWLPFVVSKYIEVTGDTSVLDEVVPFIEGPPLGDQHEAYIVPSVSSTSGTVYDHCVRALERAFPTGRHGLPLIGCGDWNDGMNEVGKDGEGESVWLAWFLAATLERFRPFVEGREPERAAQHVRKVRELVDAVEQRGWDGSWYRRAYFDDGQPLGSHENDECRIDSLGQTWSVISGLGDPIRALRAMDSAYEHLVDKRGRLIRLLSPPFDKGSLEPGYIKGYLPGIRENGGQYTHAGAWMVIAAALLGQGDRAFEMFMMMNPVTHTSTTAGVRTYVGEPYALCGDVYAVPPHVGRAGWSWYTGSSGWLFQAAVGHILGLSVSPGEVRLDPCVPASWDGFSMTFRHGGVVLRFDVRNPSHVSRGVRSVTVDGVPAEDQVVRVADRSGDVAVVVEMG